MKKLLAVSLVAWPTARAHARRRRLLQPARHLKLRCLLSQSIARASKPTLPNIISLLLRWENVSWSAPPCRKISSFERPRIIRDRILSRYRYVYSDNHVMFVEPSSRRVIQIVD